MNYNIISGGGGNCTRVPVDTRCFPNLLCDKCTHGLSELRRDCVALRELGTSWHRLTRDVRRALTQLTRFQEALRGQKESDPGVNTGAVGPDFEQVGGDRRQVRVPLGLTRRDENYCWLAYEAGTWACARE